MTQLASVLVLACVFAACGATQHAEVAGSGPSCNSCFAPEACAGETRVCPAGADCFAPEVCADTTTTCPR